jgi:hypothetical protein
VCLGAPVEAGVGRAVGPYVGRVGHPPPHLPAHRQRAGHERPDQERERNDGQPESLAPVGPGDGFDEYPGRRRGSRGPRKRCRGTQVCRPHGGDGRGPGSGREAGRRACCLRGSRRTSGFGVAPRGSRGRLPDSFLRPLGRGPVGGAPHRNRRASRLRQDELLAHHDRVRVGADERLVQLVDALGFFGDAPRGGSRAEPLLRYRPQRVTGVDDGRRRVARRDCALLLGQRRGRRKRECERPQRERSQRGQRPVNGSSEPSRQGLFLLTPKGSFGRLASSEGRGGEASGAPKGKRAHL